MQLRGIPVIYYLLIQISYATSKSYHYGITGSHDQSKRLTKYQSTSVSMNPLESDLRLQQILKKLEDPGEVERRRKPKTRKLHGVINEPFFGKPVLLTGTTEKVASRKKSRRAQVPERPEVNEFEMELARQIEEDQLKFVQDEKNPLKYVVENGLLFKQSRYSPLARVEIPEVFPKKKKKKSKKNKGVGGRGESIFRTNVFRGNINRQIPAIPLPSPFSAAYGKPSFAIQREEDGNCYINRFGYRCCDQNLEAIIMKSYEKLIRRTQGMDMSNLSKIAATLRRDTRQVFAKNFEAIVASSNFGSSIPSEFSCKVELGPQKLIAEVFVPDLGLDTSNRRHRIPYHELSREDLSESADLVVSRNGILVSQM